MGRWLVTTSIKKTIIPKKNTIQRLTKTNCIFEISAQKRSDNIIPENIAIPPNIGTVLLCDDLSPGTSASLNFSAKKITRGIATYVMNNEVKNAKNIL